MDRIDTPIIGEIRSDGSGKLTDFFRQGQSEKECRFIYSAEEDSELVKLVREMFFQADPEPRQ